MGARASYLRHPLHDRETSVNPTVAIIIVLVCVKLVPLVALTLRLWSQNRYHRRRQDTLVTLASRLPRDTLIEIDDFGGGGTWVRLRIATGYQIGAVTQPHCLESHG